MPNNKLLTKREFTTIGDIYQRSSRIASAVQTDPSYERELQALKEATPITIPLSQIVIKLGATWIPIPYYEQFAREILEVEIKLFYSDYDHSWDVRKESLLGMGVWDWGWRYDPLTDGDGTVYYRISEFPAVGKKMSDGLFTMALDQNAPEVRVKYDRSTPTQTDAYLTRQAIAKQNQITRRFNSWCREVPHRAEALETIYNAKMNCTAVYDWDDKGKHLRETLKQLTTRINNTWLKQLREYQLDAIWRFSKLGGIIALEVGLGKTAVACCTVMLRQHYARMQNQQPVKAVIVVQRSTITQFYRTFLEMFPDAKVFCVEPQHFSSDRQTAVLSKMAFFDWDAVILTHDSFGAITTDPNTEKAQLQSDLDEVKRQIRRLQQQGETSFDTISLGSNKVLKKLKEHSLELKSQLEELSQQHEHLYTVNWEQLGFNLVIVDEVQRYKNKAISTSLARKISGLSSKPSQRAKDFELKMHWIYKTHGANSIIGMTGTPEPTNSLLGIYTFQTYFQPDELKARGIYCFDSWVANFGRVVSHPEPKIDGKWRITDRLNDFINVAELAVMWFSIVHIKRYDEVKDQFSDRDRRPEPEYISVVSKMSEFQKQQMQVIRDRYSSLRNSQPYTFPCRNDKGFLLGTNNSILKHPYTHKPIKEIAIALEFELSVAYKVDNFLSLTSR